MTQISKKAYKGLPVSIKVRKPHYYYQDFLEVFNDNTEKYIELREFEGLDYNFNRSQVIFDEKVLWNGYTSPNMIKLLAPSGETYLTSVKGLDYLVNGSPVIVDNVVSNFSSSNYITTNYTFLPKDYSWVWQVKFMQTESFTTGHQYIMNSSDYRYSPYITIMKDGTIAANLSTNGAHITAVGTSDFVVELNKYYWARLEFDGVDTYSFKYSTDGQSYSLIGEVQNTSLIVSTDTLWFGKTGHDYTLHGKIDFNETFVEVNNEIVWGIDAINIVDGVGCLDNITDVANERELTAFVKDDEILLSESGDDREGYTWANKVTIPQHEVIPVYKKKFSETNTNYKYTYQDENILVSLNPSGELVLSEPLVFNFIPPTSFFDYDVRFTAKVTPVDATSNRIICVKDNIWFGTYNGKVVVDNVLAADVALTANNTYWIRMAETYSVSTGKYILRVCYILDNNYTKETLPDESEWGVKSVIRDVPFFSNESTIATFGWTSNNYSWYGTMDLNNIWVDYGNITNIGDNTRIYETKWEMLEKV